MHNEPFENKMLQELQEYLALDNHTKNDTHSQIDLACYFSGGPTSTSLTPYVFSSKLQSSSFDKNSISNTMSPGLILNHEKPNVLRKNSQAAFSEKRFILHSDDAHQDRSEKISTVNTSRPLRTDNGNKSKHSPSLSMNSNAKIKKVSSGHFLRMIELRDEDEHKRQHKQPMQNSSRLPLDFQTPQQKKLYSHRSQDSVKLAPMTDVSIQKLPSLSIIESEESTPTAPDLLEQQKMKGANFNFEEKWNLIRKATKVKWDDERVDSPLYTEELAEGDKSYKMELDTNLFQKDENSKYRYQHPSFIKTKFSGSTFKTFRNKNQLDEDKINRHILSKKGSMHQL